jgi:hypothetical protein
MKAKQKKEGPSRADIAALVEEGGAINERLKIVKPDVDRLEAIKKILRAEMENSPAAAAASFPGDKFVANVTARRMETVIDAAQTYKRLGAKLFFSICSITKKAFEEHVLASQRFGLFEMKQTGPREVSFSFKSVPVEAVKKAA